MPSNRDGDETTRLVDGALGPNETEIPLQDWENYRVESLLGEGGMGRVFRAFDPKLCRYVALKFIRSDDEEYKKRFLREARSQAQIEHENVCKIYEVGEVQGKPYIAMQLIQGKTLQALFADLSLEQKIRLMEQVCDAIQAAHRLGIVHRDIKPSNILVERKEDGSLRPFVVDFGIAREVSDPSRTVTTGVVGTPAFMAPEQVIGGNSTVDRRADVYSLGSTLYSVLSGQRPFQGNGMNLLIRIVSDDPTPLGKVAPFIPKDVQTIVSKCLEKDPARRYDSARALGEDLKRYLAGEPILAHPQSAGYRLLKKIKRQKTVAVLLAAASVAILALGLFSLNSYWRAAKEVEIARKFSGVIEEMDWTLRVAYMAPLHDIRKEKSQVLHRMKEIETMMADAGNAGIGPGNFALGRGYVALQDYEKARLHLEKAWNAGYRHSEVAQALGVTLGALYEKKLAEANRIKDKETRQKTLAAVKKELREPAVRLLRTPGGTGNRSSEYAEALLAYYEENWDTALKLARKAAEETPWLYEARMLEGQVFEQLGERASQEGNFDLAKKQLLAGAESYRGAEGTCRSNAALYQSECTLWRTVMAAEFATGNDGRNEYDRSNQACKNAIIVNPDDPISYELSARTAWRWGENETMLGHDPSDSLNAAVDLIHKGLVLDPKSARANQTLGMVLLYLADYQSQIGKDSTGYTKKAIDALELSVKQDSSSATAYAALGASYFSKGIEAMSHGAESKPILLNAIEAYKKALELSPRHFGAQANTGYVWTSLGQDARSHGDDPTKFLQQALDNFQKALAINPNYWLIHTNMAGVYLEWASYDLEHGKNVDENVEKALEECGKGESLKPGNPHSSVNAGMAYLYRAEYLLARKESPLPWLQKAEEKFTPLIGLQFAEVLTGLADTKRIEAEYRITKNESPLNALDKSMAYMAKALELNPAQPQAHQGIARLELMKAGWLTENKQAPDDHLKRAEEHARKALELNPGFAQAYATLGEMNFQQSDWKIQLQKMPQSEIQDGFAHIEKCIQLNPGIPSAYATRAKLLLLQAQSALPADRQQILASSIEDFQRAFSMNPLLESKESTYFRKAKSLSHL